MLWFLSLLAFVSLAHGAKILLVPLTAGKSHMLTMNTFGQELKRNGHEVTVLQHEVFVHSQRQCFEVPASR